MNEPIYLIASGDGRESANRLCWAAQEQLEARLISMLRSMGRPVVRALAVDEAAGHGFIRSQRMGMNAFASLPTDAPLIVAVAAWQFSHHILPGLRTHAGPILTAGNWSGEWPGLVGLLNLNGSLTKAGVAYSTIWSEDYTDEFALAAMNEWLTSGRIDHDRSHVRDFDPVEMPAEWLAAGVSLAQELRKRKTIIGVFDEGCMGMYNAIIDDELLNPAGIYKERLSQSALLAEMRLTGTPEARSVLAWLEGRGMTFNVGLDEATQLTESQLLEQARMYIAAIRLADRFGCEAIGIQYQNGLTDMAPASDLVEGLLNDSDRPPVYSAEGRELYPQQPLPHFNEVDEGAAVDAIVTNRVWRALGLDPATTLHDLRWGEEYPHGTSDFIWLLMISGAVPAAHLLNGYAGASSDRQPAMYFPRGGGTLKGVAKPGYVVWSRVFQESGGLHADIGLAEAIQLPHDETARRWQLTTREWPIMHLRLAGISRDQMMARHKANHIQVAYAPSIDIARKALVVKAAVFNELGLGVHLCGDTEL